MAFPVFMIAVLLFLLLNPSEGRPQDESNPCDTNQFYNLDSCCKTPQLFTPALVQYCINEIGKLNPGENVTQFDTPDEETDVKPFLSGAGGPMIAVDCIFRNQSLLQESGNIEMEKVERAFRKPSDESWHSLLQFTIGQCADKLRELNTSMVEEKQYSNVGPGFFMACMRSLLVVNCPDNMKTKSDTTCTEKFTAVKKCGPFVIGSGEEGGSGGWMGGLLRWLVGPQAWGEQSVKPTGSKSFFFQRFGMGMPMHFMFPFGK